MEAIESSSSAEILISSFYEALSSGDVSTIGSMLTPDLEYGFHGPPTHQHLMRMLTGADRLGAFEFNPTSICVVGDRVFAEGKSSAPSTSGSLKSSPSRFNSRKSSTIADEVCWVHIWTIQNSRIVELNECFNTSVTVTAPASCYTVWQSQATRRSMPGLVFAM